LERQVKNEETKKKKKYKGQSRVKVEGIVLKDTVEKSKTIKKIYGGHFRK